MKRLTVALALLTACGAPPAAARHEPPSTVENPVAEHELTRVHLTPEAARRLAIVTATVEEHDAPGQRLVGGEISVPPGRVIPVAAPVAGVVHTTETLAPGARVHAGDTLLRLVPLAPVDRDTQARAHREVTAARAQLVAAEARLERTSALARSRAGSQRAIEEATAARDIARADLEAARVRSRALRSSPLLSDVSMAVQAPSDGIVRALTVASEQVVAAGSPLLELVDADTLWVRVPVYSGDLRQLEPDADALVQPLGARDGHAGARASAVAGPPTATPAAGTVDRYYALGPETSAFSPGERVLVSVPLRRAEHLTAVPYSAVFYDAGGSAWVYACDGERVYRRARVELERRDGDAAVLRRGPDVGACVVSVGAAELYGAEFEPGH
ncbi:MAG: efflux RND transporter periplasmic adaptor subunit [Myxococcales bacterium]|nr:efflux RND transporter periplasmic adaptor subunit [Myxococcales bacterium]